MKKAFNDVKSFMAIAGQKIEPMPTLPSDEKQTDLEIRAMGSVLKKMSLRLKDLKGEKALRSRLMLEELGETLVDLSEDNIEGVADGIADLCYVAIGSAVTFGMDLGAVWDEVQRANMSKFPDGKAIKDDHGKVIKPEGWTGPDITKVLSEQNPITEGSG